MPHLPHTITIKDLNGTERDIAYEFEYTDEPTTRDYEGERFLEPIYIIDVDGQDIEDAAFQRMFPELTDDYMYDAAFRGDCAPEDEPELLPRRGIDTN